jgi:signal transduction histidine kinase
VAFLTDLDAFSDDDEAVMLDRIITRTKRSLDLILPDEASIVRLHQKDVFSSLSSLGSGKNIRVRVACVLSRKTERTVKEFFPFLEFKPLGSGFDDSRMIVIRDEDEIVFFEPAIVSEGAAPMANQTGPRKKQMRASEAFDLHSHPSLVRAWVRLFEGLLTNREQLEELISEKRYAGLLLDVLSHDIGNYNQVILSLLEQTQHEATLDGANPNARLTGSLAMARDALERSLTFVSNVKLLGLLHREEKQDLHPVDLLSSIEQAGRRANQNKTTDPVARQKILKVRLPVDLATTGMSLYVLADELLPEIFFNLFSNALKFTQAEMVVVDVSIEDHRIGATSFLEISVVDHGSGIPDGLKDGIFGRVSDNMTGTGLGLSIIDGLVRRYEGKVWVEDRVFGDYSKGTGFGMLLKLASPDSAAPKVSDLDVVSTRRPQSDSGTL